MTDVQRTIARIKKQRLQLIEDWWFKKDELLQPPGSDTFVGINYWCRPLADEPVIVTAKTTEG